MSGELETVLRLVADGTLSPAQAGTIIEALTRAEAAADEPERHTEGSRGRIARAQQRVERAHERANEARGRAEERLSGRGRQIRIRVTEHGRQVVNLRIPIGFVDAALSFVPGIAGDQAERIRAAVETGAVGPILDVEDSGGDGVLITVE